MISHPVSSTPMDGIFIFAQLADISCSACAPVDATQDEVEAFANEKMPGRSWQAVNKARSGDCNEDPVRRQHWYLLRMPGDEPAIVKLWPGVPC